MLKKIVNLHVVLAGAPGGTDGATKYAARGYVRYHELLFVAGGAEHPTRISSFSNSTPSFY